MIQNKITQTFLERSFITEGEMEERLKQTIFYKEDSEAFMALFGMNCLEAIRSLEAELEHYKEMYEKP